MASALQTTSFALLATGLVLGGVSMLVDWGSYDLEIFELKVDLWGFKIFGESLGWFDSECEDCGKMKAASILISTGGGLLLVGVILGAIGFTNRSLNMPAAAIGLAAALTIAVGTGIFVSELYGDFEGEEMGDYLTWGPGLYLSWATVLLALVGGVMMLMASLRPQAAHPAAPNQAMTRPMPGGAPAAQAAAPPTPPPGGRRLKCPKCANLVVVGPGQKPSCTSCGFGT